MYSIVRSGEGYRRSYLEDDGERSESSGVDAEDRRDLRGTYWTVTSSACQTVGARETEQVVPAGNESGHHLISMAHEAGVSPLRELGRVD